MLDARDCQRYYGIGILLQIIQGVIFKEVRKKEALLQPLPISPTLWGTLLVRFLDEGYHSIPSVCDVFSERQHCFVRGKNDTKTGKQKLIQKDGNNWDFHLKSTN